MQKKEVTEIKKLFTIERNAIEHIRVCFVDSDKTRKYESLLQIHSLPEEEMHKYLGILKKSLSGSINKNLFNLEFPLEAEKEGNEQHFLVKYKEDRFSSDKLASELFDKIISSYDCAEKYVIISASGTYDVPGKAKDGTVMEDASDTVYTYLVTAICPVTLTKGELGYITADKRIGEIPQNFIVKAPDKAFLFPAFNDRTPDIHSMLYYSRKSDDIKPEFAEEMFGCTLPMAPKSQADAFKALVKSTLPDKGGITPVADLFDLLEEKIIEAGDGKDTLSLDRMEMEKMFHSCGLDTSGFEKKYEEAFGSEKADVPVNNIEGIKTTTVEMPEIEIKASPESMGRIETRYVDGKKYVMIPVYGEISVNGVEIKF